MKGRHLKDALASSGCCAPGALHPRSAPLTNRTEARILYSMEPRQAPTLPEEAHMGEDYYYTDLLYDMNHAEDLLRESMWDWQEQQEKGYPPDDFETCPHCGGEIEDDEECDCLEDTLYGGEDAHLDGMYEE